jgi:hypothetical protein
LGDPAERFFKKKKKKKERERERKLMIAAMSSISS